MGDVRRRLYRVRCVVASFESEQPAGHFRMTNHAVTAPKNMQNLKLCLHKLTAPAPGAAFVSFFAQAVGVLPARQWQNNLSM